MRKPTLLVSATTAVGLAALGLSACGSSTSKGTSSSANAASTSSASSSQPSASVVAPAASTKGVTLIVGDQAGTGAQSLLQASGLLSKIPFKVSFQDFTSGPPMLEALTAGHVDIGGVGAPPPVFAAAGSSNLAIVGALKDGPNAAAIVVSPKSGITSIKQLEGRKIAVATGSSADYHLLTVLQKAGLTSSDVEKSNLQPAEGLSAIQSGAVQAWDVWSPFVEEAVSKGDRVLVNGAGYGSPYSYEVASKTALQDASTVAAIKVYLKYLNQAHIWADTHPDQWGAVWARATGLSSAIMDKAAADDPQTPVAVNSSTVANQQALVNAFYKAGEIPKSYSFGPYVTSAFNSSVTSAG